MKRLVLQALPAALLAAAGFAAPASAQYYGPGYGGPGYGPPPGYGDYDRPRYRRPPPDYDDEYRPRRPRYGRSSICFTSRGSCPTGIALPPGSPCRCDIPGFGLKRGATQ